MRRNRVRPDGEGLGDRARLQMRGSQHVRLRVLATSDATREVFEALEQRSLRMSELVEPEPTAWMARRELRSQVEADIGPARRAWFFERARLSCAVVLRVPRAQPSDRPNQVLADMTKQPPAETITLPFVKLWWTL